MKKIWIIALHMAYWGIIGAIMLLLLFIITNISGVHEGMPPGQIWWTWIAVVVPFVFLPGFFTFYMNYFVLFERLLRRRRIGALILGQLGLGLVAGITGWMILAIIEGEWVPFGDWSEVFAAIWVIGTGGLINGVVGLVLKGFVTWFKEVRQKEQLAEKNHEMEMALVKAQLSPHFLFNTLNNIDVLIEKDPAKASEYLQKLSGIMRFMLYETSVERIGLAQELEYIDRYLQLQKIRSANEQYVQWQVEGDATSHTIAPMLFFPFIENAFKHLVHRQKDAPAIQISLSIQPHSLHFHCRNQFSPTADRTQQGGGLGLELIEKRLALLYPGKYTLRKGAERDFFVVDLQITLS